MRVIELQEEKKWRVYFDKKVISDLTFFITHRRIYVSFSTIYESKKSMKAILFLVPAARRTGASLVRDHTPSDNFYQYFLPISSLY